MKELQTLQQRLENDYKRLYIIEKYPTTAGIWRNYDKVVARIKELEAEIIALNVTFI